MKANHNIGRRWGRSRHLGFKLVKKHFESKSQLTNGVYTSGSLGFKLVKKHFESKSQQAVKVAPGAVAWF